MMVDRTHTKWMAMALSEARKAEGETSPNPCVGAVVVRDGELVGKGYHSKAGAPHAEVEALKDAGDKARGATCYVTLEPCCFFGKTPACTDALIKAGVEKVVFAVKDPNPRVSGQGMKTLQNAGIQVEHGVLEEEAAWLNRHFFHFIQSGTPFVTLKYAMTADGKVATVGGESQWITGPQSRQMAHRLRHISDAVLVGAGTVRADDPALTVRLPDKTSYPIKVILDDAQGLGSHFKVFNNEGPQRTLLFTSHLRSNEEVNSFLEKGTEMIHLKRHHDLDGVMTCLGEKQIVHLMVEGGSKVSGQFIAEGLVHEVWVFVGPKIVGGAQAPGPIGDPGFLKLPDATQLELVDVKKLENDVFLQYRVTR